MKLKALLPKSWSEKCQNEGFDGPLSKQFIPSELELKEDGFYDPIGDLPHQVCKGLIHRYYNRVLFLPTNKCPVICRYCFRKHEIEQEEELFSPDMEEVKEYLLRHPEIEEVIFSGGDPFSLSNEKLNFYLESFSTLESIKWIRFHTRYPTMIPARFNSELLEVLSKWNRIFQNISLVIHINHWNEWDQNIGKTFDAIKKSGVTLMSQTVLLKGVNDQPAILKELFENLSTKEIRPYYLHHPDLIKGGGHFYLPLERGREIYHRLRDLLPGWMIPQYVVDIPQGYGKIPATNADQSSFNGKLIDKNGMAHPYPNTLS